MDGKPSREGPEITTLVSLPEAQAWFRDAAATRDGVLRRHAV